jgi:hypothetical protein
VHCQVTRLVDGHGCTVVLMVDLGLGAQSTRLFVVRVVWVVEGEGIVVKCNYGERYGMYDGRRLVLGSIAVCPSVGRVQIGCREQAS